MVHDERFEKRGIVTLSEKQSKKVLIVGAGIGGLTAALCFIQFGWTVELYEERRAIEDLGAGIQISPNAMRVYQTLGVDQALIKAGFLPEAVEMRLLESGRSLARLALGDSAVQRWGAPYLHIHRADLCAILADFVEARQSGALRLGHKTVGYAHTANGAEIILADGQRKAGNLVLGADGIHSVIRLQMLGPQTPRYTGYAAWRSVVPVAHLGDLAPGPVAGLWLGKNRHGVTYRLRGGALANLVAVTESPEAGAEAWRTKGQLQQALADFQGSHPSLRRLLENSDQLYRWALYDRAPLPKWSEAYVVLIGDAAHPMLPFMSQGAAMAIEDAWMLAACLDRYDPETALAAYYRQRRPRTSKLQAQSAANARSFHRKSLSSQILPFMPNLLTRRLLPTIIKSRFDPVYRYDVTKSL